VSQVLHILRKDFRHLRWLVLLWVGVLVLRVTLSVIGAATAGEAFASAVVFRELSGLLAFLQTMTLALLVARVIHDEPLVGWNAFWLTRPYSRNALLMAKLIFITIVLLLVPLIADMVTMSMFDAGAYHQLVAAPSFVSSHLSWALALSAVAVLTPSLATFVLAIIGVFAAGAAAILLMASVALAFGLVAEPIDTPILSDPTPGVVGTVAFIFSALAVVVYQYRHRRWRIAATLAGAGLLAAIFLPQYWPWRFLQPSPPDVGGWADNAQAAPVTVEPRLALNSSVDHFGTGGPPKRQIHAFVQLTGTPPRFGVQGVAVSGTLSLPDGTALRSRQMESFSRPWGSTEGLLLPTSEKPAHAVLDARVLNDVEERYEEWPALLSLTDAEHAQHKGKTGRFDAALDFRLYAARVWATLPMRGGAVREDRLSRIEVVRAAPISGGYRLVVRHWRVVPFTSHRNYPSLDFFLRNRRDGTAVALGAQMSWMGDFAGTSIAGRALSAALVGFSFASSASAFTVQTWVLEFPWRMQGGVVGLARLEPEWFDDAEFVIVETAYAGTVTRRVTIGNFTIPAQ
jgi:hypothetical protein